jgi:hypothetical protein
LAEGFDEKTLWTLTRDYLYDHIDLPAEELYDVCTAWVFASWTPELWTVVPYLFFSGPVASGKTRALEVLQKICHRGVLGSNVSNASLYRGVEQYHPTVFLDETEIYSREHKAEVIGLLNSGYRRGQYAWRCSENNPDEVKFYDVFGFKALAGTEQLRDTLESRSIIIKMMKNVRDVNFLVDEARALEIRNALLVYRLLKLSDISDISDVNSGGVPPQLKFGNGRVIELFHCMYSVANEGQENILEYARKTYENRLNVEETSVEAEVLECIVKIAPYVENSFIETKEVAKKFNEERNEKERWKTRSIGRLIRRLGLDPKRGTGGKRGWIWDQKRIDYLCKRYRVDPTPPKTTSLTSLNDVYSEYRKSMLGSE